MRRAHASTLAALVLLLAPALHAQTMVRPIELPEERAESVLLRFTSGGQLDPAARGLAITDAAGQGVPYRVLAHDPAGETWLAFQPRAGQAPFALQYGAKPLQAARPDERVPASLLLQTFPLERRGIRDPSQLASLVASLRPLGTTAVQHISFAHNPFGPRQDFVTLVQGQLRVEQGGTYRFFSVSDDASFVEVAGRMVIAQPEARVVADQKQLAQQSVAVELAAGLHAVRYLHVQEGGQALGVLGLAEGERAFIIPPDRFVHHPEAKLGAAGIEGGRAAVGFDVQQLDQVGHDGVIYTRFALRPIAPPPQGMAYRWSFGDGTALADAGADGGAVEHVFAQPDPAASAEEGTDAPAPEPPWPQWTVRLTLAEGPRTVVGEAATVLRPHALRDVLGVDSAELVDAYAAAIARADYGRAEPELMAALWRLAAVTERPAAMAPLAEAIVTRFGNAGGPMVGEAKHALATHLAAREPERAAQLFGELARSAPDSWHAAAAAAEQLDLQIFRLGQAENVEARVNQALGGKQPRERALLKSKIGDAHRAAGRYQEAAEAYRAAQQETYRSMDARQAAVLESAHRETALAYLRQERLPALRDQLLQWEADFPTAKLGGDLPLLAGRYFQAVGDDARAAMEFRSLLAMNPLHPSTPEVTFRLAESLRRLGQREEARELFEKVVNDFPNSPFARQAQDAMAGE